ncbi:hypothetical protein WJX72_010831 [[Myrmecia] bisecta]|uniref:Elongator complex protein 2 n=1 Tax=[Myrmecia] bisecta TaxID=41462 RepID=A0AAW1QGH8_9CHLO
MEGVVVHVSVGCNRVVNGLAWAPTGLVAYAAHNLVALYNVQDARVVATLLGHTARVNCLTWLPQAAYAAAQSGSGRFEVVVSGAADRCILVWAWQPHQAQQPWRLLAKLEGHTGPVTAIAAQVLSPSQFLLVSTAGDQDVHVWECSLNGSGPEALGQGSWRTVQTIPTGFQMQHCVAITHLPADPDWLVLALGGVDNSVRLLVRAPGGTFKQVCSLMGHGDWVRALDFCHVDAALGAAGPRKLLLASASQDKYLRVWAITLEDEETAAASGNQADGSPPPALDLIKMIARYAPQPRLQTDKHTYTAVLEALLIGHEDWVHSAQWQPPQVAADGKLRQPLCLLSASMDRTMMLWRPDTPTGLWMGEESVGDAGASNLGYYGGVFGPDGLSILAHGFTGALHLWRREGDSPDGRWVPQHALGGHYGGVVDLCWGIDNRCLLSVSTDQTTRITTTCHGVWCEVARPQVHGHDFSSVASIPAGETSGSYRFASGSEEKVIRVFDAPQAFQDTLAMARGERVQTESQASTSAHEGGGRALGAAVAALGLSNKAVYSTHEANGGVASGMAGGDAYYQPGPDLAPNASPAAVGEPPLEEHLAQNTLWPETRKLYGHGDNLFCMAASPCGRILASACKAQAPLTAAIWLWNTATWADLGSLQAHSLTVTQLEFSPDGQYLLSGSRDRTFAVFKRTETGGPPFVLMAKVKAHARLLWSVSWAYDSRMFATASRDGTVKLWAVGTEGTPPMPVASLPKFGASVNSVAFSRQPSSRGSSQYITHLLAVGLETGSIQPAAAAPAKTNECGNGGHAGSEPHVLRLASCGDDHSVRVFEFSEEMC